MTETNLDVLARLAGGLCREARIARVVVSPNDRWFWDGATRTLSVGARTLAEGGPEVCAGIVAHEIGHVFLSRRFPASPLLRGEGAPPEALLAMWGNAIEDPRVEAWMARRYPGVAAWFAKASRRALAEWPGAPALRHAQWAIGACIDGDPSGAHIVAGMFPEVHLALEQTRAARVRYRDGFLPPADLSAWTLSGDELQAYEVAHRTAAQPAGVSHVEMLARLRAGEATRHAEEHIFPAVIALFDIDVEEVAAILAGDPALERQVLSGDAAMLPPLDDALHEARFGCARGDGAHAVTRVLGTPCARSRLLARRWIVRETSAVSGAQARLGLRVPGSGALLGEGVPPQPVAGPDAQLPPSVPVLVTRLEQALRAGLRREKKDRARGHAHTGVRADLRRVMVNEGPLAADPARHVPVWHCPERTAHDAAFALLIDCSGSMRGERIEAAVRAADVFAQALARVGAPYLVNGFQNRAFPLARLGGPLAQARSGIAAATLEVAARRPQGNNRPGTNDDGPCLLATAKELLRVPARQHVLVVLSDGRPAGRRGSAQDLHDAVATLGARVDLVGVGVGEGATHVRDFYPRHVVVPRVEELPERLVRVLGGMCA